MNCLSAGGGIGADCNGYPENGVRYDSPTFSGFSVSGGVYEDKVKDIAVKYAADWNSIKFAAAFGFSNVTDEGNGGGLVLQGGGGVPFQDFRRDADVWQVGASIMHVPSGLWAYGLWQEEDNNGTQWKNLNFNHPFGRQWFGNHQLQCQPDRCLVREGRHQAHLDTAWRHGAVG